MKFPLLIDILNKLIKITLSMMPMAMTMTVMTVVFMMFVVMMIVVAMMLLRIIDDDCLGVALHVREMSASRFNNRGQSINRH